MTNFLSCIFPSRLFSDILEEGTVAPQTLLQGTFDFNFDATQRKLIAMDDFMRGLTPEQAELMKAMSETMRIDNGRATGAGATSAGAGGAAAVTAEQSVRDVMVSFVNNNLGGNASGLAASNSSGLGKRGAENSLVVRGADSSLESARTMAAGERSAQTSAMLSEASAVSALERDMDKVPKNGQPSLRTAVTIKGLVPTCLTASILLMETIDAADIDDTVKQHLLTVLQDCVKPVLAIDDHNEKFLKFIHFGYQSELGGKPNLDVARAMFEGKQHSTIATVSKQDEREYALFLAAAKEQNKTQAGSGKKDPPSSQQNKKRGGHVNGGGRDTKKTRTECEHCGSYAHVKRDCDWYRLSPREATEKRKAAQADKRPHHQGRR